MQLAWRDFLFKILAKRHGRMYNEGNYPKRGSPMRCSKILYYALIVILVVALIVSGTQVACYVIDAAQQKDAYDELAAMVEQARSEAPPPTKPAADVTVPDSGDAPASPTEPAAPSILPEYVPLYEKNADTVGWIKIEGTSINYPVMQTPDRVDYYLKRSFDGAYSAHGCLYVRESCDVFAPSDNVTIYGHHMKDGSMFAGLKNFSAQSFWEEYHTIDFDTLYEHHTYMVFAVFTTSASAGKGFAYHRFESAADESEFDQFVSTCKSLSLYDTGITPEYGDKLICLSTCEYSQDNGRLVVVAVRDPEAPNFE